ncbi:hypothetical protein Ciccas_010236 [Cichlidogyrus casuarinus]|uniref:Uncharacterized protein n=1 Tax=Cichlidogyrus casuarinus TaxID=1844966 RepID=A0ABD2PUP6_9PLAT
MQATFFVVFILISFHCTLVVMPQAIPTCTRVFSRFIDYSARELFKNESIQLIDEMKVSPGLKMKQVRLVEAPQVALTGRRFFYTIENRGFFNTSILLTDLLVGFKLKLGILPSTNFELYFDPIDVNVLLEFLPIRVSSAAADNGRSLFRVQVFDVVGKVKYNSKKSKGLTSLLKLINAKKLNEIMVDVIEKNAQATMKSVLESLRLPDLSQYIAH